MDWGSVAGLALALIGVLLGQVLEGGRIGSLVQPAAFSIVMIGTLGAVLLQSGLENFIRGMRMARLAFLLPADDSEKLIHDVTNWSATARREGLLSLERYLPAQTDPFIEKGLRLVIDGIEPYKLRETLEIAIGAYETQQRLAVKIWESAGGYAPTVGILGAVLGLIHVMENLSDPARLGSGIAVAFVATIYGVGFANLVFLPIGGKLKMLVNREVMKREMLADAFGCIATGDNPRLIEERMATYLQKA
ncbi:MAG: flagellar motor protein [Herminiimonas sp.]|nr:flagellar motor protein [Herminiimonas sp.]